MTTKSPIYVYLKPHGFGSVAATKEVENNIFIDYDKAGNPIGVEILYSAKVTAHGRTVYGKKATK